MGLLSRTTSLVLVGVCSAHATAQTPPDTVKRDTTRVTTLGPMRTEATRIERQIFDQVPAVGRISLGTEELKAAPRFFSEADLLRTVQLLPGVEARNDFSAGMNVRGGEADQNLVLLDGYPIYNPFHMGGLFGTFVEPMVGRVEVFTGAFPASYGNRLSSVLDVRSATEARQGLHGTANVSLIASQMSLGSSFAAGMGSWKLAARRTYIDKAVKTLTPEEMPYDFRDMQGYLTREFSNGLRASVTAYAGHDQFKYVDEQSGNRDEWIFGWGNRVLGSTIGRAFANPSWLGRSLGDSLLVEQRVSVSTFDADVNLGGFVDIRSPVRDLRTGGVFAFFGKRHTRSFGWEVARQKLRYQSNFELPIFPSDTESYNVASASAHYNDLWRPNDRWVLDAGARIDALRSNGWVGFSPSLTAKYFLTTDLAITAGVGQYAQWIRSLAREEVPIRPLDFWVASQDGWPVSRSRHFILGTEGWLDRRRAFRIETFYKTYHDLLERNPLEDQTRPDDDLRVLQGSSIGADFLLRQLRSEKFTGWAAYTFAINKRRDGAGNSFSPAQDRRHDLNVVGNWQHTKYTLGFRFNFASGTPYTFIKGSYERRRVDPATGEMVEDNFYGGYQFLAGDRNGKRLPPTKRLDLSVMRNGHIRGASVAPYLSIVNTMNARNVFTYIFDYGARPPLRRTLHQLSIVPTVGVSIAW